MRKRLGIISLFVILFIAFITVWNFSYQTGKEEAYIPIEKNSVTYVIPSEAGVFQRSKFALDYANMPIDKNHERSLKTYYNNRAYHGAPPNIPHPVKNDLTVGDNTCLQCHENGGFTQKFNAYAPVTPHPELVNCRQCHVEVKTNGTFKPFAYRQVKAPKVGINNAVLTRPSAPKEIRVSHPERVNCRQCHVINNKEIKDIGVFIKQTKNE